ncbi:SDR family NAD(P)-dependent oxidoreductase, partial [Escherichia coli]|nr:SDR family NAD(P)-dependent oxidoreductase [Escherichia coli]
TITGRDHAKLQNAVADITAAQPQAQVTAIVADLGNAEAAKALIVACPDTDKLINNLGFYEARDFADITDDGWLNMFNINVMSGVRLSRHYF